MCGICGYVSKIPIENGAKLCELMIATLKHRGPDSHGQIGDAHVRLGATRLAILDLSGRGNQPMSDESNQYWITFNGEIFNYLELRKQLETKGYKFTSSTDTEVALKAYIDTGIDSFRQLRGMWAICIWDRAKSKLIFTRDYFGIKPLYFYSTANTIFWASEIKSFQSLSLPMEENQKIVCDYLLYGLIDHTEQTFFKNIWQLKPAECIEIDTNLNIKKTSYWNLKEVHQITIDVPEQQQINTFREAILETINISLRSDVPVWVLLSGGLDSSSIVSIIRHLYPEREINVLSVVHEESEINEYKYIQTVERKTGCKIVQIKIQHDEWLPELDKLIYHQDEPVYSTTVVNHWFLMKELQRHRVKVTLSGQGMDEMLYGYIPMFIGYLLIDLFKRFQWTVLCRETILYLDSIKEYNFERYLQLFKGLVSLSFSKKFKAKYIDKTLALVRREYRNINISWKDKSLFQHVDGFDHLHNAFYRMMQIESLPRILHYEDRNSMAFSVEQRVPFLDRLFVEFIFALPTSVKVRNGYSKWILRQALKDILPEEIRLRTTKLGFNTPEEKWITSPQFQNYIKERKVLETLSDSIIDTKQFAHRVNYLLANKCRYSPIFWRVYNYGLWKQIFKL